MWPAVLQDVEYDEVRGSHVASKNRVKVSYLSKTAYHADKISKSSRDFSIAFISEDSTPAILV